MLPYALNQYTQRTVPGNVQIRGEAAPAAIVTASSPDGWDEMSAVTGRVFVAQNPEQFTYDADGNMTSDGRFHYFWNGENRLVCASNSEYVVTYAYDHRERMVTKTLCASASSAPLRDENSSRTLRTLREIKTTTYIWDNWNIIREIVREGDSVAVTDNIWGLDLDGTLQGAGGVGGLLAVVRDDGVFLPTYDANGNVSEYISTDGEIVAHYDYSPFGEPLVSSGPLASTFTHQFSTKPYCAVIGFSEYQMRKYRPEIGRWMSRDPIGEYLDYGLYGFVGNRAQELVDYIGLSPVDWSNPIIPPDLKVPPGHDLIIPDIPRLPEPYNPIFLPPSYPPIPFDYPLPCREWYEQLPSCPCSIELGDDGCPKGSPFGWTPPSRTGHRDGTWEIRSYPPYFLGPGQQCVYDSAGKLITKGSAVGTPDHTAPVPVDWWIPIPVPKFFHCKDDCWQWIISEEYDHKTHPPNKGVGCPENDGKDYPPSKSKCPKLDNRR